jgi:hypothetical protein
MTGESDENTELREQLDIAQSEAHEAAAGEASVQFPYPSLKEATKDKFAKIGGPDQAWRFLVKGFKSLYWRKKTNKAAQRRKRERERAEAEAFIKTGGRK